MSGSFWDDPTKLYKMKLPNPNPQIYQFFRSGASQFSRWLSSWWHEESRPPHGGRRRTCSHVLHCLWGWSPQTIKALLYSYRCQHMSGKGPKHTKYLHLETCGLSGMLWLGHSTQHSMRLSCHILDFIAWSFELFWIILGIWQLFFGNGYINIDVCVPVFFPLPPWQP